MRILFFISLFSIILLFGLSQIQGKETWKKLVEPEFIDGEFNIILHKNITRERFDAHLQKVNHILTHFKKPSHVIRNFTIGQLKGYTVFIKNSEGILSKLQSHTDPDVRYIEKNIKVHASDEAQCIDQQEATWGIVRTNEKELKLDGIYEHKSNAGEGVQAYVIDTGILTDHVEFKGRAFWGTDTADEPSPETDLNGHGTHVTGTIIGKNFGIAKKATAVAIRVLDKNGFGSTSGVVKGIEWATNDYQKKKKKSVANMSLGGGVSRMMNEALAESVSAGITFVVAAGNEAQDACKTSPASEKSTIAVGCSDNKDMFCYFSNYGECVSIIAPGAAITSSWIDSNVATNTISGTSMSSPHVAGVVANYLSQTENTTPAKVKAWLLEAATKSMIRDIPDEKTPNKLAFTDCNEP